MDTSTNPSVNALLLILPLTVLRGNKLFEFETWWIGIGSLLCHSSASELLWWPRLHWLHWTVQFVSITCSSSITSLQDICMKQSAFSRYTEYGDYHNLIQGSGSRPHSINILTPWQCAWLCATPSPALGLYLAPEEMQLSLKWWLGRFCGGIWQG